MYQINCLYNHVIGIDSDTLLFQFTGNCGLMICSRDTILITDETNLKLRSDFKPDGFTISSDNNQQETLIRTTFARVYMYLWTSGYENTEDITKHTRGFKAVIFQNGEFSYNVRCFYKKVKNLSFQRGHRVTTQYIIL